MSSTDETTVQWNIGTVYGARTRKGLVQVRVGDREPVLMEPAQAREIAEILHEAAASALVDEHLMAFLQDDIKMPLDKAALVLDALRRARQEEP